MAETIFALISPWLLALYSQTNKTRKV